ncbi:FtsK/SpoIIIE domain-containing protein [Kibdelosporangium persicum]|uniref:Cell division protein FtsX n=1 Tax=Kibdelosporangium persicum TaxID=2698649 RepID=A0ABX2FCZ6_9PSEU|nr:FtsK/SpoIIIE domain-containing protein [Kibdelosporangium persicum]NRN68746.1 Cell division protein FtsX [Kibdelosporangium persicum]
MWTLSVRPSRDSGLAPVDVTVRAQPGATVLDLANALGQHISPGQSGLLVAPVENGTVWPADRRLDECGLRAGKVLEVVTVPANWAQRPGSPARRRAVLRVVSGPDAGLAVALSSESATIGREASCTVTLADPLVSRLHARVLLTPTPVVVDEGSAHGTAVDGSPIRRPTPVGWGAPIELGDSAVVLEPAGSEVTGTGVLRPPRFGEPLRTDTIEVPAPPDKHDQYMSVWTMLLMPLVLAIGMLFTSSGAFGLVYLLAYPVAILGTHYLQRRHETRRYERELAHWREDFDDVLTDLDRHNEAQRERAFDDHPELSELPRRILVRHPALWNRKPTDPDFLAYRFGLGPVPAMLDGEIKDGGERDVLAAARTELATRRVLPSMPVCVSTGDTGVIALAGPRDTVNAVARALIIRLCTDHSPTDLSIAAVLGRDAEHHETWLRWLPQVTRRVGGVAPVAVGATDGQALLDLLAAAENGTGETLCVVDEDAGVPRRVVEAVAAIAAQRRLRLLWLGKDPRYVPSGTDVLLDLTASVPAKMITAAMTLPDGPAPVAVAQVAHRDRTGVALVTDLDRLDLATAWTVARSMTGYTDEAAVLPADTALPEMVRLPEITGDVRDADDEGPVLERWRASRGLRAQIGMGVDGPVTLDLRDDGPHGLVAGTTGSGKSELLQTLICSLALNNPPSRMTFLLVDYKGGAAFRECADLPHTVGYITDLTPALVKRALTSLTAEVNAREETLEQYGAKDLIALEREHPEACPPSLLICVDEFAALTAEVPDFVDGMVNIAQRGRSLGMHMLLATQRPAGVITAQIKANTDLRIALRVNSTDDSSDVIERKDAATISRRTPGRAWIRRTGHGTTELVQSAWVGACEELRAAGERVDVRPFTARELRGDAGYDTTSGPVRSHARTDLDRLVTTIGGAFVRSGQSRPKRPWLPALPGELPLGCRELGELLIGAGTVDEEQVPGATEHVLRLRADTGQVPIGLADRPKQQTQPPVVLDFPQAGHILVYGTSGSGKTELLRTTAIAATLAAGPDEPPPYVYGIDFAGGGLGVLDGWPSVGSIIKEQQPERVLRLLRMLKRTVDERNAALAGTGAADLGSLAAAGYPMPRIHVLIDNLPSLNDTLEGGGAVYRQHADLLASVLQDGRRCGVHITATSPRRSGVPAHQQASFGERLVLRMTTDDDYMMLGAPSGVVTADSPPGRGLLGRTEIQVATIGGAGTPVQQERMRTLAALVEDRYADAAPVSVPRMPDRVPQTALPAPSRDELVVAVEADYVSGITIALTDGPVLIAGRSRSGKSSALAGIAGLARRSDVPPAETVLIGPGCAGARGRQDYDTVLDDLATIADWLPGWRAALTGDDSWRLLLIDDVHVWERAAENGGEARDVLATLAGIAADAARTGLAVIVATDPDESRSRPYLDGPVLVAKGGRRGLLLQPDYSDGSLLGITMPSHTVEPLTGPGRGLWCTAGIAQVAHAVSGAVEAEA